MHVHARSAGVLILLAGCAATPATVLSPSASLAPPPASSEPTPAELLPGVDEKDKGFGSDKSYFIPAGEIVTFEFLLNQFNRHTSRDDDYDSDAETIHDNLDRGWVIDQDIFATNQIAHPYAGSMYHGFARSAGLNYWEAFGYTFAGSALWEIAGETTPPSLNDQITTTLGGSFLGEAFFRSANWLLERGGARPGFAREFGAAALSPPTGLNRRVFGRRFRHLFSSEDAAVSTRALFGAFRSRIPAQGASNEVEHENYFARYTIDYGMPGKKGYDYDEPFDYYHLDFAASSDSDNHVDHILVHGLLLGDEYGSGGYDGVWGLYGSYAYLSPGIFRLANSALSLGTTAQDELTDWMTLQGTLLGGIGYGAAGTIATDLSERDYHYGLTPQAVLDLRMIFANTLMAEISGRGYQIGGAGYNENGGREEILQVEAALTFRVTGPHALRLAATGSWRDARYDERLAERGKDR